MPSSRPSTAGGPQSRPSTAKTLSEAGVKDPLMHVHPKLGEKRFLSEEQLGAWEKQMMGGLDAIARQVAKTSERATKDMDAMKTYLRKADAILAKEAELQAKKLEDDARMAYTAEGDDQIPETWGIQALDKMHPAALSRPSADPAARETQPRRSRKNRGLQEAKEFGEKTFAAADLEAETIPEELGRPDPGPDEPPLDYIEDDWPLSEPPAAAAVGLLSEREVEPVVPEKEDPLPLQIDKRAEARMAAAAATNAKRREKAPSSGMAGKRASNTGTANARDRAGGYGG